MNFISSEFILFLLCLLSIYYFLGHRLQNVLLLVASYVFYGWWDWRFLFLIATAGIANYCFGLVLDKESTFLKTQGARKYLLIVSVIVNFGVLGYFKYFNFFLQSTVDFLRFAVGLKANIDVLTIILPVGISFYTFQNMGYVIDVYEGRFREKVGILDFMLFSSFFPQLVAGPIERAGHLLPQITQPRPISLNQVYSGIQLVLVGFFKKAVLADNLAPIVDSLFRRADLSGAEIFIATFGFTFQIYFDFSAYTDIARGVGRLLGFDLSRNFLLPYFSRNPREFWRRWHVTLSNWFRDYLYIPLGGGRRKTTITIRNLMVTMILCGFWHGASWNFVLWGCYHAILSAGHRLLPQSKSHGELRYWLRTVQFFPLVAFGWLIFRIQDIEQLWEMITALFCLSGWTDCATESLPYILILTVPVLLFQVCQHYRGMELWNKWPIPVRAFFYIFLIYATLNFTGDRTDFIYFQF